MYIAALWRYPVKSMAGEPLCQVEVSRSGLEGDRIVQVSRSSGRVITARTCPGLLGHRATLDPSGHPLVDGRPWTDATVLEDVRRHVEPGATLARDEADDRFDILPLLVVTDGAIAAFGRDARRLRPNLEDLSTADVAEVLGTEPAAPSGSGCTARGSCCAAI